jgi:hypothetical protein
MPVFLVSENPVRYFSDNQERSIGELSSVPPHPIFLSMPSCLGFMTVIEQPPAGFIGGYIVLNQMGRPLEFSCTTPVKPNTAQEILYGDSLEPFFYGELIAQTLLSRSKYPVSHVLTDTAAILPVQEFVETPVIYVFDAAKRRQRLESEQRDNPVQISEELNRSLLSFGIEGDQFVPKTEEQQDILKLPAVAGLETVRWQEAKIGNRTLAVPNGERYNETVEEMKEFSRTLDLSEPFCRIMRAVEEVQRVA